MFAIRTKWGLKMIYSTHRKLQEFKPSHQQAYEVNQLRIASGLIPMKYKIIDCMTCAKKFESEGAHNRMCSGCRQSKKADHADHGCRESLR